MNSVCRRFRFASRSSTVDNELGFVLVKFAEPMLGLFRTLDQQISSVDPSNASVAATLTPLVESLIVLSKIFLALTSPELADLVGDHVAEYFSIFHKYLHYNAPILAATDDETPGPLDRLRSVICEIVDLFSSKYPLQFPMMDQFVSSIWALLMQTGKEARHDMVPTLRSYDLSI